MARTLKTEDAYARALKSDDVTLIVGDGQEHLTIKKAFLALHSNAFAEKLTTKVKVEDVPNANATTIDLRGVGVQAVKVFARWAYTEHLQPLKPSASKHERLQAKLMLIDLWIFCDMYGISRLQNEAMAFLCDVVNTPDLIDKNDTWFIFDRTPSSHALRYFAVMALVAQLPDDHKSSASAVAEYTDINTKYPEMMAMVYSMSRSWIWFSPDEKAKRSDWNQWVRTGEKQALLKVPVQPPADWVLTACGVVPPKPFGPGEIIELD
ncbi:uncharacterized protein MYCFIDRAFT_85248 [Pseudocercospora fijiensis CIRAD86]|uniref:BTB domain-containing protein n=1 Tax=Pseudocercospora fijiensis (strain CIRAD86) TaxID=383855 RepID=M3B7C8_PSEFD|nr:uncharacterized protein MYCFIDRAFT_85248 [Pseudocercospora fijiensis CIRAD86]EME85228.1 hypothetical protein MYCFIDRAFT_85248 [Pseudocercospora fijiensis CIRAD86]